MPGPISTVSQYKLSVYIQFINHKSSGSTRFSDIDLSDEIYKTGSDQQVK